VPSKPFHHTFTDLRVWRVSHELALEVGRAALKFPVHERYCLAAQLRRAVLSVPTNIVEGYALWGSPSYLRHLRIALGSLAETQYLLLYARDSEYMQPDCTEALLGKAGDVHRQLLALIRAIQKRATTTHL